MNTSEAKTFQIAALNAIYVDDDFAGTANGDDPDGAGPATAFGLDAFATFAEGVNAVPNHGRIILADGDYREAVVVTKAVTVTLDDGRTMPINTTDVGTTSTLVIVGSTTRDSMKLTSSSDSSVQLYFPGGPNASFTLPGKGAIAAALFGGNDNYRARLRHPIGQQVHAGAGNDAIYTGVGDDVVFGGSGADRIHTNLGNDVLVGGDGQDFLDAGYGADVAVANLVQNFTTEQFYQLLGDWSSDGDVDSQVLLAAFQSAMSNDQDRDIVRGGGDADLLSFWTSGSARNQDYVIRFSSREGDVDVSDL